MGIGSGSPAVLFVDANPVGRLPLEVGLLAAEFQVIVAGNEAEALSAFGRTVLDLVIADAETLGRFTPAVGRRMKADSGRVRVPLLVLANDDTFADRAAELELSVDDLLLRPVWSSELVERARLALKRPLPTEGGPAQAAAPPSIVGLPADVPVVRKKRPVESKRHIRTIKIGTRPDVPALRARVRSPDGVSSLVTPDTAPGGAACREPGIERRGEILSGTIQSNQGTGRTAIGWSPALATAAGSVVTSLLPARFRNLRLAALGAAVTSLLSTRFRNLRLAALGALVGCVAATSLFLASGPDLPTRSPTPAAGARAATRIAVTPLPPATLPVVAASVGSTDGDTSPVQACRDVSALGKAERTVELCNQAFMALPESAQIAAILAQAELAQGHHERAGGWAQRAVDLDPSLAEPHAYLGFVADQAGRRREAHAAYRRYLALAPRGPYAEDINAILDDDVE